MNTHDYLKENSTNETPASLRVIKMQTPTSLHVIKRGEIAGVQSVEDSDVHDRRLNDQL